MLVLALYYIVGHAWTGRTRGKVVTSLVVVPVDGPRRIPLGRAVRRTAFTVLLPALAWVALILGAAAVAGGPAAITAFTAWAAYVLARTLPALRRDLP